MDSYDVVVVGAGISGLAAAKILAKEGLDVLVIEARERTGGRIHTVSLDDGPVVDLGANYLHGCVADQNIQPLFTLASKLNISTATSAGDVIDCSRGWECPEIATWRDHLTGEVIPLEEVVEMSVLLKKCLSMVSTFEESTLEDSPDNANVAHLGITLEKCLSNILSSQCISGHRLTPELSIRERGIFESLLCRYICYINPVQHFPSSYNLFLHDGSALDTNMHNLDFLHHKYMKLFTAKTQFLRQNGPEIDVLSRPNTKWEDRLVVGGFSKFIDFLSDGLNISYTSVVNKISWSGFKISGKSSQDKKTSIKVSYCIKKSDGDNIQSVQKTVACKYCVVSLPVGVLKGLDNRSSVKFTPALPIDKRRAIDNLGISRPGVDTHNKVILHFSESDIFWEKDTPHLECPDPRLHILNLDFYGQRGVLVSHVWAGSGLQIQGRDDESIVTDLLALLSGMYRDKLMPRGCPAPRNYIVTRWSEDPFSLGSYTCGNIVTKDSDRHAYAASLPSQNNPRLLFCGEGTVDSSGAQQCSHGAFLSGVDRAITVLEHLTRGPSRISSIRIVDYLTTRASKLHPPHRMSRRCMRRQLNSPLKPLSRKQNNPSNIRNSRNNQVKLNLKHVKQQKHVATSYNDNKTSVTIETAEDAESSSSLASTNHSNTSQKPPCYRDNNKQIEITVYHSDSSSSGNKSLISMDTDFQTVNSSSFISSSSSSSNCPSVLSASYLSSDNKQSNVLSS